MHLNPPKSRRRSIQLNPRIESGVFAALQANVLCSKRTAFVEEALRRELESQATALISESQK